MYDRLYNFLEKNWLILPLQLVGNKAKRATLKTCITRKQNTPYFPKNKHFTPLIWRALFSCNTRFEICPFTLLPTNFDFDRNIQLVML